MRPVIAYDIVRVCLALGGEVMLIHRKRMRAFTAFFAMAVMASVLAHVYCARSGWLSLSDAEAVAIVGGDGFGQTCPYTAQSPPGDACPGPAVEGHNCQCTQQMIFPGTPYCEMSNVEQMFGCTEQGSYKECAWAFELWCSYDGTGDCGNKEQVYCPQSGGYCHKEGYTCDIMDLGYDCKHNCI